MANYATFIQRYAYLSEDFGRDLAMRKFNLCEEQLEQITGRYVKGKHKGRLKGKIIWTKCTRGGWVKTGPYDWDAGVACGYVTSPGKCNDFSLVDAWTDEPILWDRDKLKSA